MTDESIYHFVSSRPNGTDAKLEPNRQSMSKYVYDTIDRCGRSSDANWYLLDAGRAFGVWLRKSEGTEQLDDWCVRVVCKVARWWRGLSNEAVHEELRRMNDDLGTKAFAYGLAPTASYSHHFSEWVYSVDIFPEAGFLLSFFSSLSLFARIGIAFLSVSR